jgi:DNA (cytosine-5)-methyltransferase 1
MTTVNQGRPDRVGSNDGQPQFSVVDLFCGVGGLSLGFEMTGKFDVAAAFDNWEPAVCTFNANRKRKVALLCDLGKEKDARKVTGLRSPHAVLGGPPCQDFSQANKARMGNGANGNLTPLFADLACAMAPHWIVMENVNTIESIGLTQLEKCVSTIKNAGYGITATVLDARDFGVPQARKRLFLVARKNGIDDEMLEYIMRRKRPHVTVREFRPSIFDKGKETEFYYRHPWSYGRRAIFSIDEQSPTIRGVSRPIPKTYRIHKNDATKNLRLVRPLTYKERATIQTFPKSYTWCGTKTDIEQQIGNAVPPLLGKSVAEAILLFRAEHLVNAEPQYQATSRETVSKLHIHAPFASAAPALSSTNPVRPAGSASASATM